MPLTGRLWWRREAFWGLELDGILQPPALSVELIGAKVWTRVKLDGGHSELPSGPAALIEFEAESVNTTPVHTAANDNGSPDTGAATETK
jgi:hypothetical protein